MRFRAILFDVIGTTVLETKPDTIVACFREAFQASGVDVSLNEIQSIRGRDKNAAISQILLNRRASYSLALPILQSFKFNFSKMLQNFSENPEFGELIQFLKSRKVFVGVGTGLPQEAFDLLFHNLRWDRHQFDYVGVSERIGRGRPDPDMIIDMMSKLSLDASQLLKVGDTPSDIREGKNANVKTAAILSGTSSFHDLSALKPDYIIHRLSELKSL